MKEENAFEELFLKTIDKELKRIFGEAATLLIYSYLEDNLSLKQEDIPRKIEVFSKGLDLFLSSGAKVVEKVTLENLYSSFGFEFKIKKDFVFVDYVNELKKLVG
jgi:hypothetical protein